MLVMREIFSPECYATTQMPLHGLLFTRYHTNRLEFIPNSQFSISKSPNLMVKKFFSLGLPAVVCLITLVGCNFFKIPLSSKKISQKIEKSVVPIYYKGGHGSGFFVSGTKGVCTVLTSRHVAVEVASLDEAIKIKPDDADAWEKRGKALSELDKYEDAIASFDKVLDIKPNDAFVLSNQGKALEKLGKYQDAIASFDKAIEIRPGYAWFWNHRGNALKELGKYEEAITSYDKAIKIDPDFAYAWNYRGEALENLKRDDEALESYEKAMLFDSNNQAVINNRKRLLKKLGR